MAATSTVPESEVEILNRLIRPGQDTLPVAAARAILRIDFDPRDRDRMHELAQKARAGTLTRQEQAAINSYELVGHLLDLLHSKARQALR